MKWKKSSSAGQKLPDNWQEKREHIIERIRRHQRARYDDKLKRNFPNSKFLSDSDKMLATIQKEQKQLVKS